nr:MAG: replication associated protein [Cressdnaviricota sp.]
MPFRFHAKKIFLTYPQCGELGTNDVAELLRGLGANYVVGREAHADGKPHIHAYGEWSYQYDTRNERQFDCGGNHPNIQPVRNKKSVIDYCKKEGDYISNIDDNGNNARYQDLVGATTESEFWGLVEKKYARDYVLHLDRLREFSRHKFGACIQQYTGLFQSFRRVDELEGWIQSELGNEDRPKTLWLTGASRLGKTEWSRSHGRHMYFNGAFNLDDWDTDATYIVWDDFDWKWLPYKKQFVGAQRQFVVSDKYRKKRSIMWGKPSIFVWNDDNDPWRDFNSRELEWYEANTIRVVLTECLFTTENVWVEI